MKLFYFYSRTDKKQEPIAKKSEESRLTASRWFAATKRLSLKSFLKLFGVSK